MTCRSDPEMGIVFDRVPYSGDLMTVTVSMGDSEHRNTIFKHKARRVFDAAVAELVACSGTFQLRRRRDGDE